jgi:pilus assembly protein CpaB
MRTTTLVSLGASAVLGLGALIVARLWLPSQAKSTPTKGPAMAIATVPVVVARADIPYGAKLDPGRLTVAQFPAGAVPAGAYSSIPQVIHGEAPPVVLTPIAAREPVLPTKLSGAGAKATVAAVIGEGMRAYTIRVDDVAGGGGHVLPGDRVDVVLTYDLSTIAGGSPPGGTANGKRLISTIVLQDVRVLGMDLNADPSSTQAVVAHTATLEVSAQDAERLALAAQAGSLSMALRRTGAADIAPVRAVNVTDVGGLHAAQAAARAHPIAHHARARSVRVFAPVERQAVIVVHGGTAASVEVPTGA